MATNKLMEAAAEILAKSKSSAPGMPMPKLPSVTPGNSGTPEDLGGPTPQNYKNNDNSAKLANKAGAKSATAPTTKPSDASPDTQNRVGKNSMYEEEGREDEDQDQLDEVSMKLATKVNRMRRGESMDNTVRGIGDKSFDSSKPHTNTDGKYRSGDTHGSGYEKSNVSAKHIAKKPGGQTRLDRIEKVSEDIDYSDYDLVEELRNQMHDDMQALFSDDETISEDFKIKAATIFEARVFDRVAQIQEQLEEEYAGQLVEAVETIKQELTEKVDDYLNYVVEQWMEENEIAIESGLRSEITEDFIAGLRNLFAENYINVPEDKVELVDELASKVEELEVKLNEEIEANIQYKKQLTEAIKVQLVNEVCEGLTATQVEKIKTLAESVEFSTEEEFVEKLETIRENYFPSGVKKANVAQLHEEVEDDGSEKKTSADPYVASVMQAISKTKI
jgi:hypothetical protein